MCRCRPRTTNRVAGNVYVHEQPVMLIEYFPVLLFILIGVAFGLVAAYGVTRVMTSLLFEVKPTDTATLIAVSLLLMSIAFLATYLPARRATKIDPLIALRHE